jgi:hypothetical protein
LIGLLQRSAPALAQRYQVRSIGIFGSYARRQQHHGSDLDVLVDFSDPPSLLKFIEMENHLSDLLGVKVDLVMRDALRPGIRERILREVIAL